MPIIGIDLGTSNTCAAVFRDGKPEVIFDILNGERILPSYVAYDGTEWMVGLNAKQHALDNLKNTVFEAKRLIGRSSADPDLTKHTGVWPFEIVNEDSTLKICLENEFFSVELIQSKLLEYVKQSAESQLKEPVNEAVISVPAYFSLDQRDATKRAAELAGLTVRRLIHEPTAAAIAYGWNCQSQSNRTVLVFDLGGGTFDVSILKITDQSYAVLATNGDISLGGRDIDETMVKKFAEELKPTMDIMNDSKAIFELRSKCELAKKVLSRNTQVKMFVAKLYNGVDFKRIMYREEFDQLNLTLFQRALEIVKQAIVDAGLECNQVDEVLMVGGSSRIPKLEQMLIEFFGRDCLNKTLHPDEVVAQGAAILARTLEPKPPQELNRFNLTERTARSLSTAILGGTVSTFIRRNTELPVEVTKTYITTEDNQTSVIIKVYEGERVLQRDNNCLGVFTLSGIRSAKEGEVTIKVTFKLDESGCLIACAKEEGSGIQNQIIIERDRRGLGDQQVHRAVYGAEGHEEEDNRHQRRRDRWNEAYRSIYRLKRKIESMNAQDRKQQRIQQCEETAKWFRDNQLADDDQWKPKIKELFAFCDAQL